jgi:uncharacterized protein YqfA (UPF0365 family)
MSNANTALFNDPNRALEVNAEKRTQATVKESVQVVVDSGAVSPVALAAGAQASNASERAEKMALLDNVLKSLTGGSPSSLQRSDDVWAFMTSRPGAVDSSVGTLLANSDRTSKESVGNVSIPSLAGSGLTTPASSGSEAGQILAKAQAQESGAGANNAEQNGQAQSAARQTRSATTVAQVPLPGTLALIGLGLLGALAGTRRRKF